MAEIIKLSDFGKFSEQQVNKLIRVVVLETDLMLKIQSPVDLGRFRLSWAIGENAAPFQGMPPGDYRGQAVPPPRRMGYSQERVGNVYSIHNNLPYAERLAIGAAGSGKNPKEKRYNPSRTVTNWASPGGGSSIQTGGPGWVDLIVKQMANRARQLADQIGRQS
jgi:hypothetical protein